MSREEGLLVGLWVAWCGVHSLLISIRASAWLRRRLGEGYRFFRLGYNLFSLVTLLPLVADGWRVRGETVFAWEGWLRSAQMGLLLASGVLFYLGAGRYDLRQFAGLRQMRNGAVEGGLKADGGIDASGVLGALRHPWYAAGILLVWARDMSAVDLWVNGAITAYFGLGSLLEERKLVQQFGAEYEAYRRRVPMLIPWKWLLARIRRRGG